MVGAVAVGLGAWAFGGGLRRLGIGAMVAGVLGAALAVAATESGVGNLERVVAWGALGAAMLRYATPLIFAAMGGVVSERSGVVNIGLEGMLLSGAYFGVWGADVTGGWVGGLAVAVASGAAFGLVHAVFAVTLKADQIVAGTAINFLALGITGYLFVRTYGDQGTPNDLPEMPDVHLPIESACLLRPGVLRPEPARLARAAQRRRRRARAVPDAARACGYAPSARTPGRGHGGHLA